MREINFKRIKRYANHPKDISQLTYLTHSPRPSSDECKDLGDFGSKYAKYRPTKDCGQEPATKKGLENIKIIVLLFWMKLMR